ncbi:MAG: glycosyltransferase family 2 protein [Lysobacteraceae bacterium]|nr:MAG: glycosyltransferase family 2 protein [Xanthomonadaceae bacterium]
MIVFEAVFWLGLATIVFAYAGYPLLIALLARARRLPRRGGELPSPAPTVDVLLVVHNAADLLAAKLANLAALEYPRDRLRINVACDGCDDRSEAIARGFDQVQTRVFAFAQRRGKSACIGEVLPALDAEVVLFVDVRQRLETQAARWLVAALSDPAVGAASGELVLEADNGYGRGIDAYWRYEKLLRKLESASGSLIGVTGALYAARRELLPAVPGGIVLDDMWIPLRIAAGGHRVVFVPEARAYDRAPSDPESEERRKRRTLAGNFQLLHLWPQLALPGAHPLSLRLWGHKWLRLLAPWLLLALLASSLVLALSGSAWYALALGLQLCAYAVAVAGRIWPASANRFLPIRIGSAFLGLNSSALLAFFDYLSDPHTHLWQTTRMDDSPT